MDGGGSKQNRVRTANSQLKNEHGRSFFSVPAGVFCTLLASAPPIFKKANGERLFRTDKDVGGSIQKRVCLQTRSPRMYTDVHSWARHLRRCCAKINARRTKSTSPLYFCSRLVSVPSIFKKANGKRICRTATDGSGSKQNRVRTANSQLKNEHGRSFFSVPAGVFCTLLASAPPIFKKANGKRLFRTDKDVGGSIQKRVCLQTRSPRMYRTYILGRGCPWFYTVSSFSFMKNSKFTNVQGRTFLNDGIPVAPCL